MVCITKQKSNKKIEKIIAKSGHLDIAALLIKHKTSVNATDRWGFSPLHEVSHSFCLNNYLLNYMN